MGKAAKALGGGRKKPLHAHAGVHEGGQFIGRDSVLHAIVQLLTDRQHGDAAKSDAPAVKKAAPGKSTAAKKMAAKVSAKKAPAAKKAAPAPVKKVAAKKAPAVKGVAAKKLAPKPVSTPAAGKVSLKKVNVGDYDVHVDGKKVGVVQQPVGVKSWRAFPAASTGLPQMLPGKYKTRKDAVDALFAAIDEAKKPKVGDKPFTDAEPAYVPGMAVSATEVFALGATKPGTIVAYGYVPGSGQGWIVKDPNGDWKLHAGGQTWTLSGPSDPLLAGVQFVLANPDGSYHPASQGKLAAAATSAPLDVVSLADMEDMAGDGIFDAPLAYGINPETGRLLKIVAYEENGDYFFDMHEQNPDGSWDEAFMTGVPNAADLTHDIDGKPDPKLGNVTWYAPIDKAGNPPDLTKVPAGGQGQAAKAPKPSIYDPVDQLPAGAEKASTSVQESATSGWDTDPPNGWTGNPIPTVRRVKVPPKSGFGKKAYDYYFDNVPFGTVEQSLYGGWETIDPSGTHIGFHTSQAQAIQGLIDRYDVVHELIAKGDKAAAAAKAAAQAKAEAKQAAAAGRIRIDADLARLRGRSPNPTEAEKAVYGGDFSQLARVGPQGGFTEGGVFEAPDGSRWYVKAQLSPANAANEALAVDLYRSAGIDIPEVLIGAGTPGLTPGAHTATRMLDTVSVSLKDRIKGNGKGVAADHRFIRRAHEGFAVDAWLANWDVAGENPAAGYDNIVDLDARPVRIDAGGALLFRGTGGPKGDAFGPAVTEWERFTDPQSDKAAAALFDTIRREDMIASAERVKAITPAKIRSMVKARGLDPSLADTLIERRKDIISRAKAEAKKPRKPFGEGALTEEQAKASIPLTTDYDFEATLHSFGVSKLDSLAARVSLKAYKHNGYKPINKYLYGREPGHEVYEGKTAEDHVRDLDIAFSHSALTQDILVYQGSRGPGRMFPPGEWSLVGGMDGKEFTVEAYWSSSTNKGTAENFATDYIGGGDAATAQSTVMKIVVPKGTAVIDLMTEGEVLLNRGLRYRVVKDRGVGTDGVRRLDVEVI